MTISFRMLPAVAVGDQTININSRSYSGAPGSVADVNNSDAQVLAAAGWTKIAFSGPTTSRPTIGAPSGPYFTAARGTHFLDTTIGALIVWDGQQTWV